LPVTAPTPITKPASAPAAKKGAGGGFRETAWFKQGEIDEELAKRQAQVATEDPLAPTGTTGRHAAVDANKVSPEDQARLSLKTGSTQAMPLLKGGSLSGSLKALPGERMDEADMLAEIDSSRKWFIVAGVLVVVVAAVVILYFTVFRSSPSAETPPPPKPAAVAAAPPVVAPPAPAAPAPVAPPPATPVANPAAPVAKASATPIMAQAEADLHKDDLAAAVENFHKAADAGGDSRTLKKLDASISKALLSKVARAKRHKDKESEAEARALLAKLHKKS
jgi:hypothetical protein